MDAVRGFAVMMLQMDETAGELDEGFVKNIALALGIEPDVLEDIMGLVIFLRIEETEVFEVAGMPRGIGLLARETCGDLVVLAHAFDAQETTARRGRTGENGTPLQFV